MNPSVISLVISALGGAIAALLLRALFRLIRKLISESKPLSIYYCAEDPIIKPIILVGLLLHGKGKKVNDKLACNKVAWEHSTEPAGANMMHTIYGPYVNDFGKPGFYKVRFSIYGKGFSNDEDPILILDIIQRPTFMNDENLILLGQRVVKSKELSNKYKYYDVYCYVTGSGTFEYRVLVISEAFDQAKHTLRFDVIKVYNHVPSWEIF